MAIPTRRANPANIKAGARTFFVTSSAWRKQNLLQSGRAAELFLRILYDYRGQNKFRLHEFVVMPDHFRLLMVEPAVDTAANSIEMLQQRYQRRYNTSARSTEQVWESRYSDVHVFGPQRIAAQLEAMHQEPVRAGLAASAADWEWSSARFYAGLPEGVVTVERA